MGDLGFGVLAKGDRVGVSPRRVIGFILYRKSVFSRARVVVESANFALETSLKRWCCNWIESTLSSRELQPRNENHQARCYASMSLPLVDRLKNIESARSKPAVVEVKDKPVKWDCLLEFASAPRQFAKTRSAIRICTRFEAISVHVQ